LLSRKISLFEVNPLSCRRRALKDATDLTVEFDAFFRAAVRPEFHQPSILLWHHKFMQCSGFRVTAVLLLALPLAGITACTDNRDNPDEIRRRTAEATETMRRDAKAVAEGVREGMQSDRKAIDINRASREELLKLPDLTEHEANRIIATRPFQDAHDLVTRRVIPESEYAKIRDQVIAGR
jgi:competence protein ComEA